MAVVALRKESVDRNITNELLMALKTIKVALRKESVDRNVVVARCKAQNLRSLSARRAWIEIFKLQRSIDTISVALRKESVDRNIRVNKTQSAPSGRSPQGERG